jgi:regulatory protein
MASREPGRSSSSPSVRIQQLVRKKRGRPGEEITVVLDDASSFSIPMRVWEDDPFHETDELDLDRWESILARSRLLQCRSFAMSLIARAEHSRFLLRQKLLVRNVDPDIIDAVLHDLTESGALSDDRYAVSWTRSRMRSHPEGRTHLVAGLRNRGIDPAAAERAIDQVLAEESLTMLDGARSYVERLTRRRHIPPEQIEAKLYRRGFSPPIVRSVIAELPEEPAADQHAADQHAANQPAPNQQDPNQPASDLPAANQPYFDPYE